MKLIDVSQAKATAETLLADPVLQWAVNAVLDNTPLANVEEVTYCNDCEYWRESYGMQGICRHFDAETDDDDFCSHAERKKP